jgi:hypothetical protein
LARSQYIYILEDWHGLIAAFTVKHEAVSFWEFKLDQNPNVKLYRIPDGHKGDPGYIDLLEYRKDFE